MDISLSEIKRLTGLDHRRISQSLADLQYKAGPQNSKLYDSRLVFPAIYGSGDEYDDKKERARLTKHQADKTEIEVESLRGRLIPEEEVVEKGQAMVAAFASRIRSIPVKLAPEVAIETDTAVIQEMMRQVHDEALHELSGFGARG